MYRYLVFTICFVCSVPFVVNAKVFISEVAWMGSNDNANAEWIELYNDGEAEDVTGWTLKSADGQPDINLTGTIAANSYALLERTSDDTVPNVTAFLIYTGSLGNSGELLELRDSDGALIDSVDGRDSWSIGGNNETKETLQRSGTPAIGIWTTASANPKGTVSVSGQTDDAGDDDDGTDDNTKKISFGGGILNPSDENKEDSDVYLEPALIIDAGEDRTVTVGVPATFTVHTYKEKGEEIVVNDVDWNFGDGMVSKGRNAKHTFLYKGDYVVSVVGTRGGFLKDIIEQDKIIVHVIEPSVKIINANNKYIEIKNNGNTDFDLSNFVIVSGNTHFIIPENSTILPQTSVRFSSRVTGIKMSKEVKLFNPNGNLLSELGLKVYVPKKYTKTDVRSFSKNNTTIKKVSKKDDTNESTTTENKLDKMTANLLSAVSDNDTSNGGKDKNIWWWLLALASAIFVAIVASFLIKKEKEEIIEGYIIESDNF